jgi:hypothetical protein
MEKRESIYKKGIRTIPASSSLPNPLLLNSESTRLPDSGHIIGQTANAHAIVVL